MGDKTMINKYIIAVLLCFIFLSNFLFGINLSLGDHCYLGDLSVCTDSIQILHCSRFKNGVLCIPIIVTSSGQIVRKRGWKKKKELSTKPINVPEGAYLREAEINSGPTSIDLSSESFFPLHIVGTYQFDPFEIYFATAIFRNEKELFATQIISFKVVENRKFIPIKEKVTLSNLSKDLRKVFEDELFFIAKNEKLPCLLNFGL
jgi:hypothetical protein